MDFESLVVSASWGRCRWKLNVVTPFSTPSLSRSLVMVRGAIGFLVPLMVAGRSPHGCITGTASPLISARVSWQTHAWRGTSSSPWWAHDPPTAAWRALISTAAAPASCHCDTFGRRADLVSRALLPLHLRLVCLPTHVQIELTRRACRGATEDPGVGRKRE